VRVVAVHHPQSLDTAVRVRRDRLDRGDLARAGLDDVERDQVYGAPMAQSNAKHARRGVLGVVSVAIIVSTFVYFLPQIANYGDVWKVVSRMSWESVAGLAAATVLNLATFAPPWQVVLPGLGFRRAMEVTQASTALSIVLPGGLAVGAAGSYGMLRRWGFGGSELTRAVMLTGVWNQLLNLSFPIVAVFLLALTGEQSAALGTVAFIGVAILGVIVAGFAIALASARLARDLGDVAARLANWGRGKIRRSPVTWGGENVEAFRRSAGDFVVKRWHVLTLASLAGSLSVFLLFVVALHACGVRDSQVSLVEAFAAWALVRMVGSIPITPGGVGIIELGLTGALVGFGGPNARVVAAVLVYRFLTVVPSLVLGLVAAFTFRRQIGRGRPEPAAPEGV
jgi:uncharacterized protein (TIRG00374 family)